MPTPHPRLTVIVYPSVEESIEKLMEAADLHKSAIIKEALEVGIGMLEHKYGLTSSRRVSEMTEEQLRTIVRQEVAAVAKISSSNSTPEQLQRFLDNAIRDAVSQAKTNRLI
jgi:hypothetical protein